jgi:hypothetical protein
MLNIFGMIPTIYSLTGMYWIVIIPIMYLITRYTYIREIDKEGNFEFYIGNKLKIRIILVIFNILIGLSYIIIDNNSGYAFMYMICSIGFIFILKSKKERFKILSTKEIKKFKEEQEKKNI